MELLNTPIYGAYALKSVSFLSKSIAIIFLAKPSSLVISKSALAYFSILNLFSLAPAQRYFICKNSLRDTAASKKMSAIFSDASSLLDLTSALSWLMNSLLLTAKVASYISFMIKRFNVLISVILFITVNISSISSACDKIDNNCIFCIRARFSIPMSRYFLISGTIYSCK